jgi:hypothetical protein
LNLNDINDFIHINNDALLFIEYMVDKYGNVFLIGSEKTIEDSYPEYHHDYFYFCLTKATRSLLASNKLADMRYREDAMVLIRSAYETYLLMANVIKNESFISNLIIGLMLINGRAKYFRNKNGKVDFHNIILDDDKESLKYDMSISTLAKKTFSKYDRLIHKELYKYMSEFLHSDFIGSGNYRTNDDKKYEVKPKTLYLDVHFFIMYITYLLIQSMHLEYSKYKMYLFNKIDKNEISKLEKILNILKDHLFIILDGLDFSMRNPNLKDMMLKRINEYII